MFFLPCFIYLRIYFFFGLIFYNLPLVEKQAVQL